MSHFLKSHSVASRPDFVATLARRLYSDFFVSAKVTTTSSVLTKMLSS
jgi:hypothetical protein